jgi:hypothetical protein
LRRGDSCYGKQQLKVINEKEYSKAISTEKLVGQSIKNFQTDNGSEFAREFEKATTKLAIQKYFSRVKTP